MQNETYFSFLLVEIVDHDTDEQIQGEEWTEDNE